MLRMLYRTLLRPVLFTLDAERAHNFALLSASRLARSRWACDAVRTIIARPANRPVTTMRLTFPNAIGLAGGMDKNGVAPLAWWAFGFGFVELGTVTPVSQPGNDPPRMFRYPATNAIVNRMGFNNDGATALATRLQSQAERGLRPPVPIGISIGKNKLVPAEGAADDFAKAATAVLNHADFLTVNVSSPNTPGLRALQNADDLRKILQAVQHVIGTQRKPLLVKIAPELDGDELRAVLDTTMNCGCAGIIATNTLSTANRPDLQQGGLSGQPLRDLSCRKVEQVRKHLGDAATLIGCGGINDVASARSMLAAGANLVQIYTGLVYEGPFLPATLSRGLKFSPEFRKSLSISS